jgi:flavorubredoxin
VKVLVCYDSKYGNTKLAAEKIQEGLNQVEGIETAICYAKEVNMTKLNDFDAIILGAPNHMGRPSRTMKNFVNKLAELNPQIKHVAVFGTYAGKPRVDRAVKKLQKLVQTKLPNPNLILPGLSVKVRRIRGPVVEGELPKCIEFGKKIATQLKQQ